MMKKLSLLSLTLVLFCFSSTAQFKCGDVLTDPRDNQSYETVQIGDQCWMAENLNYGTMIQSSSSGYLMTDNGNVEKYCWDNDEDYCDGSNGKPKLGGFYEWKELVADYSGQPSLPVQGLCPEGWHIPSKSEFESLAGELGGANLAGAKMKEGGSSGFEGTLCGYRCTMNGGFRISAMGTTKSTYYWASEESDGQNAYFWELSESNDKFMQCAYSPFYKSLGNSVRCVKDETTSAHAESGAVNIQNVYVNNGQLRLELDVATSGKLNVSIVDLYGKSWFSEDCQANSSIFAKTVNINGFPQGMYVLRFVKDGRVYAQLFMIN